MSVLLLSRNDSGSSATRQNFSDSHALPSRNVRRLADCLFLTPVRIVRNRHFRPNEQTLTIHRFTPLLRTRIAQRLDAFDRQPDPRRDLRQAAVALVIAPSTDGDEASVLVTLRPQKLNRHSGQYALPGGRLDAGETDAQAALRELHEELGLNLSHSDILGQLDDFPTRSGFRIAPFVLWTADLDALKPDPNEVARVHQLPFSELDSPEIPRLTDSPAGDHPVLSAFFPTLGHHIYAPTAAILYQFREVAMRGLTTRAAHFEQPQFAWK